MEFVQSARTSKLARTERLDLLGGTVRILQPVSITPTSVHAEDYADIVSGTATMRKLIAAGSRIAELGYNDTDDLDTTLRQAEDALYSGRDTTQQSSMYDFLTGTSAPVMSGFADLDEVLGGFVRSDLVILAARPSVGKSTLGLNMAMANAKAGQKCAIFSLEMTADQLAMRALAGETGIDSYRIRLGLYTQSQEQLIINAIGELSELPIYIDDTPYQGMVEIRGKARRLDLDRGVDLIMVDYLQLVQGPHRGGPVNRVTEITEISRSLKVMAGELNAAVIACSQMSRMVENRPSHRPQLSDLRDSGSIEQDADIVAFIHREDLYTTEEEWGQTHSGQEYPPQHRRDHRGQEPEGAHGQRPARVPGPPGEVRPCGQGLHTVTITHNPPTQNAAGSCRRHFLLPDASRWSVQSDHYRSSSKYIYL